MNILVTNEGLIMLVKLENMFGWDMLSKFYAMKQIAEERKTKLAKIVIEGESRNGLVVITLAGNRE